MRRAAAACLLLLAGVAWAAPADVRARVRALEELLDDGRTTSPRAHELDRLRQGREENESFDFFAGRVAFGEGRYEDAVSALELAGVEDRRGSYLRLARDTLAITRDHERAESDHFIFIYPKGKDECSRPMRWRRSRRSGRRWRRTSAMPRPERSGSRW